MRQIKNGRAYPKALKLAALKASKIKGKKQQTTAEIAVDFNIHKSTLNLWQRNAGISRPQPTGLATYQAGLATAKAALIPVHNVDGSITLNGRIYR